MTSLLYGRPPAVFDPPAGATQTSPLIPGSTPLESPYFRSINRNKLSLAADFDSPGDRDLILELIAGADVVVEIGGDHRAKALVLIGDLANR